MPVKGLILALLLLGGLLRPVLAAELATLFTTPEERALIDRNRYRSGQEPVQQTEVVKDVAGLQVEPTSYESVTLEYVISGITVSHSGPDMVWINSVAYEDGARLDDGSRIKVLDGNEVRVRITAPDGKQYYATSGETLEISIMVPAEARP
ncbi:MAG TPA: hypothetical protein VKB27_05870 [Gammaproteobacteria bacterium]|nr:hypothetical protein [Gammaproteobacteria bacterium]